MSSQRVINVPRRSGYAATEDLPAGCIVIGHYDELPVVLLDVADEDGNQVRLNLGADDCIAMAAFLMDRARKIKDLERV